MNSRYNNYFRIFFAFSDLFALNMVHLILIWLMSRVPNDSYMHYTVLCVFNNMAWLVCSYASGVYINNKMVDLEKLSSRTASATVLFFSVQLFFLFFYPFDFSRLFVLLSFVCYGFFLVISRLLFIYVITYVSKERFKKKVVFVGNNSLSEKLISYFNVEKKAVLVKGCFDDNDNTGSNGLPFLGKIKDCVTYCIENNITEIYSTISPEGNNYMYQLAESAENNFIRFKFVPDLRLFVDRNIHLDFIENMPILSLRPEPLEDAAGQIKKRLFDILLSSFVIVFILSWLLPILAIFIKIGSRGPVFFVQLRSGKNNQPFKCYKLRTLKVNKDSDTKQVTKNDDRFTKLGSFLRKSSLDELPQFFNVLIGNMSVVGARPHMLKHTEDYSRLHDGYMLRHFTKPGITGWAQINGFRGEIKQQEQLKKRVEHDIWYIENWNIWLDMRIIFLTFFTTLKGDKNAY